MSITTSFWGREQQINRFPAAAGSSGSGSYFTDPDINPHSQVWQTPARQDQRTGTSQASASSSRLWNFESQETVSPAPANETLGPSPYESVGGCGRQRLGALVLAPHHGADGQAAPLQRLIPHVSGLTPHTGCPGGLEPTASTLTESRANRYTTNTINLGS